ncbi:MAG: Fic family protein [Clostridia bacterium]
MENNFEKVQELLRQKADLQTRLGLIPYDGAPEVKENQSGKYIYIRKRELGKLSSQYVDKFSEVLFQTLLRDTKEARALKRAIKQLEKQLALLGYRAGELSPRVELNLDFAKINLKANIYDQAILEGVATTFPQTETIIDNGEVVGMKASDVQKILNLKHAWNFILDKDVLQERSSFFVLSYVAKIVNEGFFQDGGRIRAVPVFIGGSSYVPTLPFESVVKEELENIVNQPTAPIDKAIDLCLYCMKKQIFNDGNKRAAVIFANHFMIANGEGLLAIDEQNVAQFKRMLIEFYEGKDCEKIKEFLKEKCWRKF